MANAEPGRTRAGGFPVELARVVFAWLPVVCVYAVILLTVPYGVLVSQSLYRLEPDGVKSRTPAPPDVVELRDLPGGTLFRTSSGEVWWKPTDGETSRLTLPAPCLSLAHGRELLATCVLGEAGVAVIDIARQGEPEVRALAEPSSYTLPVGDRILVGTPTGRLVVYTASGTLEGQVQVSTSPLTGLIAQSGQVAVAHGRTLTVVDLADTGRPEVRGSLHLAGSPGRLSSILTDVYTFVGDRVLVVDTSDLHQPRVLAELEAGSAVRDIHPFLNTVAYVLLETGEIRILRNSLYGTFWWGGTARPARACGGPWGEVLCIAQDGHLDRYDIYPSRYRVIVGVGVVGAVLLIGVFALALRNRSPGWIRRLAWVVGILGLLVWILSGTWKVPIEALHILEYSAFGSLTYRALGRGGRGGAATAALAAAAGLLAGMGDELTQWSNPFRTGSIEDVFLDARAAGLGALLGWQGLRLATEERPRSWIAVGLTTSVLPLLLAGFLQLTARFGYTWTEGPYTVHSRLTREAWAAADSPANRSALARTSSLRYDDYLRRYQDHPWFYEVRVRVYRRDRYVQKQDWSVACAEQRILDRLAPTALQETAYAWGPAQTARCQTIPETPYISPVAEDLITSVSPGTLWGTSAATSVLVAALTLLLARRSARR